MKLRNLMRQKKTQNPDSGILFFKRDFALFVKSLPENYFLSSDLLINLTTNNRAEFKKINNERFYKIK